MSDTSDVVKKSHDLSGIMDGAVIKTVRAQPVEIAGGHGALTVSEISRKRAQRPVCRFEWRAAPIAGHSVDKGIRPRFVPRFLDLSPEIVRVGLSSIMAI